MVCFMRLGGVCGVGVGKDDNKDGKVGYDCDLI